MTSNLGSAAILEGDMDKATIKASVMAAVGRHFRPEFINRVDELIIFEPLDRAQVKSIVRLQVGACGCLAAWWAGTTLPARVLAVVWRALL
jgi:ATP-dependent Clp protease ATP-binding subunit ClpB